MRTLLIVLALLVLPLSVSAQPLHSQIPLWGSPPPLSVSLDRLAGSLGDYRPIGLGIGMEPYRVACPLPVRASTIPLLISAPVLPPVGFVPTIVYVPVVAYRPIGGYMPSLVVVR